MHIIIYGAGALGCIFGARLQQSGHRITYVARGAHLEAMQARGLRIESDAGDFQVDDVSAVADIADADAGDVILFAVKNYDVAQSASDLAGAVGPDTAIITVQNGVSAQPILADAFGPQHILPGVTYLPADIREPGVIRARAEAAMGGITFGPYAGGKSDRAGSLGDAFNAAGIPATLSEDIWRTLWEKFIPLSGFSATTVTTRSDIGTVRETEASRAMLHALVHETAAIAQASHPTVPENAGQIAFDFLMGVPPNIHSSMLDDLLRGKRIELDWLSGEVIRKGKALGIPTPAHEFAYAMLAPYIDGRPDGSH